MKLNPRSIAGPWKKGFTLDDHTLDSVFLGHDDNGKPKFETTRSEIGELLYLSKYQSRRDLFTKLASAAAHFLEAKGIVVDIIVPLPPSKQRSVQPVVAIAKELAGLRGTGFAPKALVKVKNTAELKSLADVEERARQLKDAFSANPDIVKGKTVLLFDDLYRSGASMEAAANELIKSGGAMAVYALALTRTRINR